MTVHSGSVRRVRSVAASLLIVVSGAVFSAWADGLPGEYLLTSRWRALHGIHSPLGNPAFLTEENYIAVRGIYSPTLQNAFRLWELGVTVPLGWYQSAGFTWLGEDDGSVIDPATDPASGRMVAGSVGEANLNSFFMFTYAVNPWRGLSAGVNVNLAYQTNYGRPLKGAGLDLGLSYRLPRSPVLGEHLVGISTINLIAPNMSAGSYADFDSPGRYSRDLRISWNGFFLEKLFDAGCDIEIKDFLAQAGEFQKPDPSEPSALQTASAKVEYDLALRGGVWLARLFRIAGQIGFGERSSVYGGLGAGLNVPSVNMGRDLEILYQYNSMDFSQGITTHSIYVRADLGRHREELYARRVALGMDASPNDLYNKALTLYHAGKYWESFFVFGKILVQFPEFFKNDWVSYYMAACQERMDMRNASREDYAKAIEAYPGSDMAPYADLGIMRVAYRDEDDRAVSEQFQKLISLGVRDSLRYHACYLMGESSMRQGDNVKAVQLFSIIPQGHPSFIFAQHSMGVAYVRSGNMDRALESFDLAVRARPTTAEQQEAVNRTLVLVGYLYYEQQALSKAVAAMRRVPATSVYYEEALVGLGWAAVKAKQWGDCITAGQELARAGRDPLLQCEGLLLAAFAQALSRDFVGAIGTVRGAIDRARRLSVPERDSLDVRRQQYDSYRITYETVARSAGDLALGKQSALALQMVDSLHLEQQRLKGEIDIFLDYADLFRRRTFFARNLDNLRGDINYLFATVESMRAAGKTRGDAEKQRQLDQEIERLKQELKGLDGK